MPSRTNHQLEDALTTRKCYKLIALAFAAFLACVPASAESWPSHFITLVVPFGAGSGTDIIARVLAAKMSELLGKQVVIENLGGAGGTIAVSRVAKAAPDGYQIVIGAVDTFAQSQYLFEKPPSNTLTDFEPIALAVEQPLLLVARKELPVSNLKEFVPYLKQHQKEMRFGSAGIGAAPYLACAMITSAIGAQATHVPYRAAAPALHDMMGGDIDYYCPLAVSAVPFMKSNSIKALAVLTGERSTLFPELPTAREQGVNVVDGYYWNAFFAPKGTPDDILAKLNSAISSALDDPTVQARLREVTAIVVPPERRTRAYLKDYLQAEIVKWSAIMKADNVPRQ
jgi:tripartite-type tricarboxylate transporter receptor subunit TctC